MTPENAVKFLHELRLTVDEKKAFKGKVLLLRKIRRHLKIIDQMKIEPKTVDLIVDDCNADYAKSFDQKSAKEIRAKADQKQRKLF